MAGSCASELQSWHWRAAGEFFQECAADVAEILDPDFAGKKSVGGHIAQKRKELDSLAYAGICDRVIAISNLIENFFLLLRRAIKVELP